MGNWTIIIEGNGQHDCEDNLASIENVMKELIVTLQTHSHYVEHATVTTSLRHKIV